MEPEQMYQAILEYINEAVYVTDLDKNINREISKILVIYTALKYMCLL